jgi:hypothetical protein
MMRRELIHDHDKSREKNALQLQAHKKCCITITHLICQLNRIYACKSALVFSLHCSKDEARGIFVDKQIGGKSECPK